MQRNAVLEEMMRTLPPEVVAQVDEIHREAAKPSQMQRKPELRRSRTQLDMIASDESLLPGAPSSIQLQKRCSVLELQLDKWVSIAQLLASELSYREKRLWDWQMDNTNTKAILQKFKDRLRKTKDDSRGARVVRGLPAAARGEGGVVVSEDLSTPRVPTSASGIQMLVVEADGIHAKARCTQEACARHGVAGDGCCAAYVARATFHT